MSMTDGQATAVGTRPGAGLAALLVARFFSELALLGVAVAVGVLAPGGLVVRIVLAVALPVGTALVWGRWVAPSATHRLADPARLATEMALFLAGAAVLAVEGPVIPAVVFGALAADIAVMVRTFAGRRGARV